MKSAVYSSLMLAIGALTPTQSQAQVVWNTLPGEFAIQTANGDYVTAEPTLSLRGIRLTISMSLLTHRASI
jgi:hypothetical protein